MRIGAAHWAGAAIMSLAAHAALLTALEPPQKAAEQRAHGMPAVTWGVVAQAQEEATPSTEARDGAPDSTPPPEPIDDVPDPPTEQVEEPGAAEPVETVDAAEPAEAADAAEAESPEAPPMLAEPLAATAPAAREQPEEATVAPPERKPEAPRRRRPAPRQAARAPSGPVGAARGQAETRADTAGRAEISAYSGQVAAHLRRHKRYPRAARRADIQGTTRVTFVLGARGEVRDARLAGGSGHGLLDREALAMVRRAAPFPPMPPDLRRSAMTFTVPIRFSR